MSIAGERGVVASESFLDERGVVRPGWRTALGSTLGLTVGPSTLAVMTFGVFAPYLREAFGWGVGQISLGATMLSIMVMIVSPVQGWLIDRFGARRLILTCIPLFGAGYMAMSLYSGPIWQFYLAWAVLPLLGVGLWPASWVKATSGWFDHRLGLAIAIATIGIGIGAAILPIVIGKVAALGGWRAAYAVVGLASILIAWPMAALFVRDRLRPSEMRMVRPAEAPKDLHGSAFWLLLAGFFCLGVFSLAILVHQVGILEGNGMSRPQALAAQSIAGVTTIAGRLLSGWLLDRLSVRIVMPVFAVAAALAIGLLAAGAAGPSALVCAGLIGALIGAEIDVLGYVVKRYFGLTRYGLLYGALFSVFQLGGAIGVAFVGMARETTGSYDLGLGVVLGACLAAALLFVVLGPYRYGEKPGKSATGGERPSTVTP